MYCPNCGAKVPDTNKFCSYCGAKMYVPPSGQRPAPNQYSGPGQFNQTPNQQPSQRNRPPVSESKKNAMILSTQTIGIMIAVFAVAFLIVALFAYSSGDNSGDNGGSNTSPSKSPALAYSYTIEYADSFTYTLRSSGSTDIKESGDGYKFAIAHIYVTNNSYSKGYSPHYYSYILNCSDGIGYSYSLISSIEYNEDKMNNMNPSDITLFPRTLFDYYIVYEIPEELSCSSLIPDPSRGYNLVYQ